MSYYVVIEGHGESEAVLNLLNKLQGDLGLPEVGWARPMRKPVTSESIAVDVAEKVRGRGDAKGLLVLRDDEDGCPKDTGPEIAGWLKSLSLPFPAAVTLFYREYETLFLPCIDLMAGRPLKTEGIERAGIRADAEFNGDPEAKRDAKGLITNFMPAGRSYKPTVDQLPLTRMLDFERLRASGLPCFATLERGLTFLQSPRSRAGEVFPIDR